VVHFILMSLTFREQYRHYVHFYKDKVATIPCEEHRRAYKKIHKYTFIVW
jgi:hypothetical protein